ncbi:phage virion morphogenesis protein [Ignavibacterium sp.]|uniref:phage virion morphogenesis protein n=1 Tax=Ignavibacterium sp. TaxID=2651167 RepID=UPI00307E4D15
MKKQQTKIKATYLMNNEINSPKVIELLKKKLSGGNKTLMASIAETIRVSVLKNIETEGQRLSKRWQKLSPKTIGGRKKKGYWPGKILQRTGQLKRSINSSYGENYAQVSTNLIYAAIHNYGGIIHRTSLKTFLRKKREGKEAKQPKTNKMSSIRIPARPFMQLISGDLEKIKSKIVRELTDGR